MAVNTLLAIRTSEALNLIEMRQLASTVACVFGDLRNTDEIYITALDSLAKTECNHLIELPIKIGNDDDQRECLCMIRSPKITGVLLMDLSHLTSVPVIHSSLHTPAEIAKDMFTDIKADLNHRLICAFELGVPDAVGL